MNKKINPLRLKFIYYLLNYNKLHFELIHLYDVEI